MKDLEQIICQLDAWIASQRLNAEELEQARTARSLLITIWQQRKPKQGTVYR